ncbi:MAG: hypothetical protein E7329_00965 [Clostridiales bacterium]|nr:hypothetical protein [Clostridiales bacterium]
MRKLLSVILALLLALSCCPALAEETEYVQYTHPTLGYTAEVPNGWFALDTDTIASFVKVAFEGDLEGVDPAFAANLESELAGTDIAMFLAVNGSNINIVKQYLGLPISAELFMSMMMPSLLTQYEATFDEISFPDDGSVYYTEDERAFCSLTVTYMLNGQEVTCTQYYHMVDADMYVFTLTYAPDLDEDSMHDYRAHIRHMLDTFVPAAE